MKKRIDFVTNSSSSSYVLALYEQEPEHSASYNINKRIRECKFSSVRELYEYIYLNLLSRLEEKVYESGMTEDLKEKYYQFYLWDAIVAVCSHGSEFCKIEKDGLDIEFLYQRIIEYIRNKEMYECPIMTSENKIDRLYMTFFDAYERENIISYLEKQPKNYDTLMDWFENMTGGKWVLSCYIESDDVPKGVILSSGKLDDGNSSLDE